MSLPALIDTASPELLASWVGEARRILAQASTVAEGTELRARAAAIESYTAVRDDAGAAVEAAAEVRLRAERRLGELLAEGREDGTVRAGSGRPEKWSTTPTISDLGISKHESATFAKLADIPDEVFDEIVEELRGEGDLSRAAILRRAQAEIAAEDAQLAADRQEVADYYAAHPDELVFKPTKRCPSCNGSGRVPKEDR